MQYWRLPVILCVLLCFMMPVIAQEETEEPGVNAPQTTPDVIGTAQALVTQAEDVQSSTLDAVNAIMAFIQVAGIAATIVGAILAFLGLNNNVRLNSQLKQAEAASQKYADLQTILNEAEALRNQLNNQISQLSQSVSMVQLGTRQVDIGNLTTALDIFQTAAEDDPGNFVLRYFIGDLYLRQGNFREGIRILKPVRDGSNLLAADASYAYALRMVADKAHSDVEKQQNYDASKATFEEVMAKDPNLLDISGESVFGALAGLHKRLGDYHNARRIYEHCKVVTPHRSYPVNNLALLYFRHPESFADEDTRDLARKYFKESLERSQYAVNLSSADYWNLFDILTAEVALEEADLDALHKHIDNIFRRKPIDTNLNKLLNGLYDLANAKTPPRHAQAIIDEIETRMATDA